MNTTTSYATTPCSNFILFCSLTVGTNLTLLSVELAMSDQHYLIWPYNWACRDVIHVLLFPCNLRALQAVGQTSVGGAHIASSFHHL
ncbi:MAG: hypothetical protein UX62_C0039G0001 [Microgenomates group bacterium GW2011_GWA2_46_7]|nr:MAG: hypothetical protein UX62_C0039G0001 [Microgenomates group bacterium GW2011_GWA2_46_7]